MGLTDIFTVDYRKVKEAYNVLQGETKKGVQKGGEGNETSALKAIIVTALSATVHAMDKHLHKFVDGSLGKGESGETANGRKQAFETLIEKQASDLLANFSKLLDDRHKDKGLLHSPDKQIFKKRAEKLIEKILPKFFLNFCRELDKLRRKMFSGRDVRPQDTLENVAKQVLNDMNVVLGRNVAARAKRALTGAVVGTVRSPAL